MSCELDEDTPLWLANEQIKCLLEGIGAAEDHDEVVSFFLSTGLPRSTVDRIHRAICCAEVSKQLRCLVLISGGVADAIFDDGIDVEYFDRDDYDDADDKTEFGVPMHFADLAEIVDVPVKP